MCNKEICRYPWVLEENARSPRLHFVHKNSQLALCLAENNRHDGQKKQSFSLGYLILIICLSAKGTSVKSAT